MENVLKKKVLILSLTPTASLLKRMVLYEAEVEK